MSYRDFILTSLYFNGSEDDPPIQYIILHDCADGCMHFGWLMRALQYVSLVISG